MVYMVTFTMNISQMLAYIPYMDTMGFHFAVQNCIVPDWLLFRPDQLNF